VLSFDNLKSVAIDPLVAHFIDLYIIGEDETPRALSPDLQLLLSIVSSSSVSMPDTVGVDDNDEHDEHTILFAVLSKMLQFVVHVRHTLSGSKGTLALQNAFNEKLISVADVLRLSIEVTADTDPLLVDGEY